MRVAVYDETLLGVEVVLRLRTIRTTRSTASGPAAGGIKSFLGYQCTPVTVGRGGIDGD
ncbi:hypothetical protein BMS3Abin02_01424 [bacterium BMS3Abin02]|nr:hypothetical protein BMS3Abin02_01424 [bacterium BMS3Abin02]GBE22228.1 hypothetical protein BMS3Bbin01_01597 [bacterium BMS3Bbin01]